MSAAPTHTLAAGVKNHPVAILAQQIVQMCIKMPTIHEEHSFHK